MGCGASTPEVAGDAAPAAPAKQVVEFTIPPFRSNADTSGETIKLTVVNGYDYPKVLYLIGMDSKEYEMAKIKPKGEFKTDVNPSTVFRTKDGNNKAEEELLWMDAFSGKKTVKYTLSPDNFQCQFKSQAAGAEADFKVTNNTGKTLTAVWVDEQGEGHADYGTLDDGATSTYPTFIGHAWRFKDEDGLSQSWFLLGKDQDWNGMVAETD